MRNTMQMKRDLERVALSAADKRMAQDELVGVEK